MGVNIWTTLTHWVKTQQHWTCCQPELSSSQFSISASCLLVSSLPRQLQLFVSQTVPSDTWGNKNMRARDDERNIFVNGLFYNRDNKWCVQIPTSLQWTYSLCSGVFFSPHIGFHLSIHLSVHIFCSFCHIFCKPQTPAPASLQLLENPKARKLFALLTVMTAAAASTLVLLLPQQPKLLFTSLSLAYVLFHVGIVDSPESLHFMFGSENKHVLRFSMWWSM